MIKFLPCFKPRLVASRFFCSDRPFYSNNEAIFSNSNDKTSQLEKCLPNPSSMISNNRKRFGVIFTYNLLLSHKKLSPFPFHACHPFLYAFGLNLALINSSIIHCKAVCQKTGRTVVEGAALPTILSSEAFRDLTFPLIIRPVVLL